jgi:hypothetical protein
LSVSALPVASPEEPAESEAVDLLPAYVAEVRARPFPIPLHGAVMIEVPVRWQVLR